jgi:hypothetical protein
VTCRYTVAIKRQRRFFSRVSKGSCSTRLVCHHPVNAARGNLVVSYFCFLACCCNTAALWLYLLQPQLLLSWSGGEVGAARTFREQGEGSIVLFSVSRLEIAHTYILYTQAAVGRLWRGERKDASNDSM